MMLDFLDNQLVHGDYVICPKCVDYVHGRRGQGSLMTGTVSDPICMSNAETYISVNGVAILVDTCDLVRITEEQFTWKKLQTPAGTVL